MKTIKVTTAAFQCDAIPLYLMPQGRVLDMLTSDGGAQVMKTAAMFKLAIVQQGLLPKLEELNYLEFAQVLSAWVLGSSEAQEGELDPESAEAGAGPDAESESDSEDSMDAEMLRIILMAKAIKREISESDPGADPDTKPEA